MTAFDHVMTELAALGTERTKKSYLSRGAREPLFGVATGAMKPLLREVGIDQALAEQLWATGNYDAMYFAGMVADVTVMTPEDFERWITDAYSPMVADHIVSVTLAESELAPSIASEWVRSDDEIRAGAGWSCYEWLLGWRPDDYFDVSEVRELLQLVRSTISTATPRVQRAMRGFLVAVGVSFAPLHDEALAIAETIGSLEITENGTTKTLSSAADPIRSAADKGRVGFKRRAVRC